MPTTKDEIAANASRLAKWIAQDIPNDVGFCLMIFPKESEGRAACLSNMRKPRLAREMELARKRLGEQLIFTPSEF